MARRAGEGDDVAYIAHPRGGAYPNTMPTLNDIETAVSKLARHDLARFRDWFVRFDAEAWDRQFAEDVEAGRLDALAEEALRDLREGRCRDL